MVTIGNLLTTTPQINRTYLYEIFANNMLELVRIAPYLETVRTAAYVLAVLTTMSDFRIRYLLRITFLKT